MIISCSPSTGGDIRYLTDSKSLKATMQQLCGNEDFAFNKETSHQSASFLYVFNARCYGHISGHAKKKHRHKHQTSFVLTDHLPM